VDNSSLRVSVNGVLGEGKRWDLIEYCNLFLVTVVNLGFVHEKTLELLTVHCLVNKSKYISRVHKSC
jgi:hypothetical protein